MQTEKNKKIGLLIMISGLLMFVLISFRLDLFGSKIEYRNLAFVVKMFFADIFLILGLYFGLYFSTSKKLANQIGGGMAIFLVVAYILGFFLH
jgi:hypothetical protein